MAQSGLADFGRSGLSQPATERPTRVDDRIDRRLPCYSSLEVTQTSTGATGLPGAGLPTWTRSAGDQFASLQIEAGPWIGHTTEGHLLNGLAGGGIQWLRRYSWRGDYRSRTCTCSLLRNATKTAEDFMMRQCATSCRRGRIVRSPRSDIRRVESPRLRLGHRCCSRDFLSLDPVRSRYRLESSTTSRAGALEFCLGVMTFNFRVEKAP